jgi:DUF4097 and DUF4098 domain-containing protein YvlB
MELVNTVEIGTENINSIDVAYTWEKITIYRGASDTLVIKEYMSRDNSDYYARVSNSGGELTIKKGRRPIGLLVNLFNARIEVYVPESAPQTVRIKTTSGRIQSDEAFSGSTLYIESSSGAIALNRVAADLIRFKTTSGSITVRDVAAEDIGFSSTSGRIHCERARGTTDARAASGHIVFDSIDGDVFAHASSGRVDLNRVTGSVRAETTSGAIQCVAGAPLRDVSLSTTSGSANLGLPRNQAFRFSSRTGSGSLRVPFSGQLLSPLSDRHTAQGLIGADTDTDSAVSIRTGSGAIRVSWAD